MATSSRTLILAGNADTYYDLSESVQGHSVNGTVAEHNIEADRVVHIDKIAHTVGSTISLPSVLADSGTVGLYDETHINLFSLWESFNDAAGQQFPAVWEGGLATLSGPTGRTYNPDVAQTYSITASQASKATPWARGNLAQRFIFTAGSGPLAISQPVSADSIVWLVIAAKEGSQPRVFTFADATRSVTVTASEPSIHQLDMTALSVGNFNFSLSVASNTVTDGWLLVGSPYTAP